MWPVIDLATLRGVPAFSRFLTHDRLKSWAPRGLGARENVSQAAVTVYASA